MGRMVQNPNDPKYLRSLLRRARKAAVSNRSERLCAGCEQYDCPLSASLIKEIDKVLEVD